jgi:hypothetical protein
VLTRCLAHLLNNARLYVLLQGGVIRRKANRRDLRNRDECGHCWYLYPAVNGKAAEKVSDGLCGCLARWGGEVAMAKGEVRQED